MIIEYLKTQRPPKVVGYSFTPTKIEGDFQGDFLTQTAFLFRQNAIRTAVEQAGYTDGDIVRPASQAKFEEEGFYKIMKIARDWYTYKGSSKNDKQVEWPKTNNPKIVHAVQLSTGQVFECTVNYFVPLNEKERNKYEATKS